VHPLLAPGYAVVGQLARALAATVPAGDAKLLRTLRARRDILARYERWGTAQRRSDRPLLWMHAPSVGEGLQARPVVQIVRTEYPRAQVAYTHFSPSAERFAQTIDADFIDYLPFDTAADSEAALDALRPSALVFSKLDVWPTFVARASRRGVKTGVISATLPARSRRRGGLGRALLSEAYARLDAVGAIAEDDAERLLELGVKPAALRVTGDTRYDQVWQRAIAVDRASLLLAPLSSDRPTVVAGSTWPTDEHVLLPAFARGRATEPALRLIIAPHEPTPRHLAAIDAWTAANRVSTARFGTPDAAHADVIVIDRVGVLGDLYAIADIAFIGGGFHSAGLHSVLEPAAFGVPVLFGPRTGGARDAELLIARGGAAIARSEGPMAEKMVDWVRNPSRRDDAGARARAVVVDGLGAARATYELVRTLLPD
jgi:3-deoxy-D-manno-octulosonic-acid transferase